MGGCHSSSEKSTDSHANVPVDLLTDPLERLDRLKSDLLIVVEKKNLTYDPNQLSFFRNGKLYASWNDMSSLSGFVSLCRGLNRNPYNLLINFDVFPLLIIFKDGFMKLYACFGDFIFYMGKKDNVVIPVPVQIIISDNNNTYVYICEGYMFEIYLDNGLGSVYKLGKNDKSRKHICDFNVNAK
jgi:hypothetical protein